MTKLTGTDIVELLKTNDKAICRALVVLHQRQTTEEQHSQSTRVHNMRGFRPCHARMGSSMAEFYNRNGYLSPKQIAYWRVPMKKGGMRIAIYWKQLLAEAHAKAAAKAAIVVSDEPGHRQEAPELYNDPYNEQEFEAYEAERLEHEEYKMHQMEAAADRAQTIRDETNKAKARKAMEVPRVGDNWTQQQRDVINRVRARVAARVAAKKDLSNNAVNLMQQLTPLQRDKIEAAASRLRPKKGA